MPISVRELNEFLNNKSYARFMNTNLHLHTPATRWDWDGWDGQTRKADTISVDEYFEELNKTSLELVAITDHNCIDWCEPLVKLARKARKEGRSKIHILPGVEITTYEGPHLIAIFDEKKIRKKLG
ncbi:PHP domain-containing protein [Chloroflexota bacterium]